MLFRSAVSGFYAPGSAWMPQDPVGQAQLQRWLSLAAGFLAAGIGFASPYLVLGVLMAVRGFAMAMFVYRLWLALAENQAA